MYGICEAERSREFIQYTQSEWIRIAKEVKDGELQRSKNLLKTYMLAQLDGTTAVCEDIGR